MKTRFCIVCILAAPCISFAQDGTGERTAAEIISFGSQVALVGMLAVFLGLITIFTALKFLARFTSGRTVRARSEREAGDPPVPEVTAEVVHAIALALYLDLRTFEEAPPGAVTIRKVTRPYSGWWNSGKTHMMIDKWTFPTRKG